MRCGVFTLVIALLLGSSAFAETGTNKSLDDELSFFEWHGPEAFVRRMKDERVDPCKFLKEAENRNQHNSSVIRRVLLSLKFTECVEKKNVVEKYLKSDDPLLREAAIRLASALPPNQRKEVEPGIKKLKAMDRDPAVVSAISEFFRCK